VTPAGRRLRFLVLGLIVLHVIVLGRVFVMQSFEHGHWTDEAQRRRYRTRRLLPRRGSILDRAGRVLASEEPTFHIQLAPKSQLEARVWRCRSCLRTVHLGARTLPVKCRGCGAPGSSFDELTIPRPERYRWIAESLGKTPEEVEEKVDERIREWNTDPYRQRIGPLPVFKNVPVEIARQMHLHPERTPDLRVTAARYRLVHHPRRMPHLIGEAGLARKEDFERLQPLGFRRRDTWQAIVGHSGLERVLDHRLLGRMGEQRVIVDHANFVLHVEREAPPRAGEDLRLTIDLELQEAAEDLLDETGYAGGFLAMDPRTGEILAMASAPRYDLSTLHDEYNRLLKLKLSPLIDRSRRGPQMPGSILKVVTAVAALETPGFDPDARVHCNGSWRGRIGCDHTHGDVNLVEALERSCNVYFIEVAVEQIGMPRLAETASKLGLGRPSGLQIPDEPGILPTGSGELRWMAFGQGHVTVTPLQMARITAAVANGGRLPIPTVLRDEIRMASEPVIPPRAVRLVREGMRRVVFGSRGTARRFGLQKFGAAAKTGTAQVVIEHGLHNAWLIGYAPHDAPEVAFACYVAKTPDHGGEACGPIVARWLETWTAWREREAR
jgi:penicillin-binding protein 2